MLILLGLLQCPVLQAVSPDQKVVPKEKELSKWTLRYMDEHFTPRSRSKSSAVITETGPIKSDSILGDGFADLIILSNEIATKYRDGYQVSKNLMIYAKQDVMFAKKHDPKTVTSRLRFFYGVAHVGRTTGPAVRWKY